MLIYFIPVLLCCMCAVTKTQDTQTFLKDNIKIEGCKYSPKYNASKNICEYFENEYLNLNCIFDTEHTQIQWTRCAKNKTEIVKFTVDPSDYSIPVHTQLGKQNDGEVWTCIVYGFKGAVLSKLPITLKVLTRQAPGIEKLGDEKYFPVWITIGCILIVLAIVAVIVLVRHIRRNKKLRTAVLDNTDMPYDVPCDYLESHTYDSPCPLVYVNVSDNIAIMKNNSVEWMNNSYYSPTKLS